MDEKIRHDKALEAYQAAYAKYQKDRTELLDWIAINDRAKDQARHNFQALAFYNQTRRAKVALPKKPQFSDFYKPRPHRSRASSSLLVRARLRLGMQPFAFF